MSIEIGIKQPNPTHIKVKVKPSDEERPVEVWFDGNIIELTKEQADELQWKLRGCLKQTGTEPSERM
jgi:hypothetical protein